MPPNIPNWAFAVGTYSTLQPSDSSILWWDEGPVPLSHPPVVIPP